MLQRIPVAKTPRPKRSRAIRKSAPPAIAFRLTGEARQIVALARKAQVEERARGGAMSGYHARRQFDQHLTQLANRIASKPRARRDDLLTLALAGWYAPGARDTLVKAILRAASINPQMPHLKVGAQPGRNGS